MSTVNIQSATKGLSNHVFTPTTVASLDFGEILPVLGLETIAGDRFNKVEAKGLLRLAPQGFPPFGRCFLKNATFFVPLHQLIEQAEAFRSKMKTYKGDTVVLPHFSAKLINYMFTQNFLATQVASGITDPSSASAPSEGSYDFINIGNSSGSTRYNYWKLTPKGRSLYKILKSLGYDFVSFPKDTTFSTCEAACDYQVNALPLLAYAKIYCDMFLSEYFFNNTIIVQGLKCVHDNKDFINQGTTDYNASTGVLSWPFVYGLLNLTDTPHSQNMYTEAWNSPNSPDGVNIQDLTQPSNTPMLAPFNASTGTNTSEEQIADANKNVLKLGSSSYLSAVGLRMIQAFDRFVRRHNIAGSKAVQRVYATFGISPDDFRSNYVHKIDEGSVELNFYPVLSQTDSVSGSNGKPLGSYAGYSAQDINISYNYKCDDFGYLITVYWLQVADLQVRGFDPAVLKTTPYEFYTPEYDGQTIRAIPYCEMSVNKKSLDGINGCGDKKIYGFTNIYDEYRNARDIIAGDFVLDKDVRNFLWCRDLSWFREQGSYQLHPQSTDVQYFEKGDNDDMTDPFQTKRSNGDRFYLALKFTIDCQRPILSYADSLDLGGDGQVSINKNGVGLN